MDKKKVVVAMVAAAMVAVGIYAIKEINEPKTYEECILKNMKDAQSERAAAYISQACRREFPEPLNPFDQFDKQSPKQVGEFDDIFGVGGKKPGK